MPATGGLHIGLSNTDKPRHEMGCPSLTEGCLICSAECQRHTRQYLDDGVMTKSCDQPLMKLGIGINTDVIPASQCLYRTAAHHQ